MADKIREKFGAEELATCLSHYDLGIIYSIKEFARGSRRAPKTVITCERGKFLFKRRQKGANNIEKIAFTHQIQLVLAAKNFPLPHLLGTRDENNSMLVMGDRIYEMQEYISGSGFDGTCESTQEGGHALGLYHKLLQDFEGAWEPPTASYHNAKAIHQSILKTLNVLKPQDLAGHNIVDSIKFLGAAYQKSAESVNKLGLREWPPQIVHGDWHPGNMLFRDKMVVAVIDYDTARLQQRVIDLANGALQFSILGGGDSPLEWPTHLEMSRFKRFLHGYDSVNVVTTDELRAIPFLMCEAMIAEAILPIASTGGFGRFDGSQFLTMIRKKVEWIYTHLKEISGALSQKNDTDKKQAAAPSPPEEESLESDALSGLADVVSHSGNHSNSRPGGSGLRHAHTRSRPRRQ
ncbi:MAG: phosphotransferase [Phycisphaerae bacterium]|nr:phosphotransferase [Phycisphaerae bacterium]